MMIRPGETAPGLMEPTAAALFPPHSWFSRLNPQQQQQLAAQFQIRSIPTLMLFKAGKLIAQQSGAMPKQMFYQWLQQHS